MSRRHSHTTHTTQPFTDKSQTQAYKPYDSTHRPMSCRTTHTTMRKGRAYKEGPAPLVAPSPSKDLNAFLTVYLRFLWQCCGLSRPLDSQLEPELTPTTTIFLLPVGSSLSIIPMCVLSLAQPHPASFTQPHSHHRLFTCAPGHSKSDC